MRGFFSQAGARGAIAALLVSLVGAGFSARAGLAVPHAPFVATTPVAGHEADDQLPDVAARYADRLPSAPVKDAAAPAAGATGTIALPATPVPQPSMADLGVRAAAPFAMAGTTADRSRALQCLTTAIYYEAANEPDAGQAAVAQVILNRVRHPAFPPSVCGVVFQGSERAGCQFSFACDGALARLPQHAAWQRARLSAARALAGDVFAPVGLATHYHTFAVAPAWNRTLVMTDVEGSHFFHRWKGWWGTAAAFRQVYRGGEPLPGPHAPAVVMTAVASVQPANVSSDETAMPARITYREPAAIAPGDILDKWKDSGSPLR